MKYFFILVVLVGIIATSIIPSIYAPPEPIPDDSFRFSDHVLTGKVISSEVIPNPNEDTAQKKYHDTVVYEIQVLEWHKNPLDNNIIAVYGEHYPNDVVPEPMWGVVEFEIGSTVYLYLDKTEDGLKFREHASYLVETSEPDTDKNIVVESEYVPPLKQIQNGAALFDVKCSEGKVQAYKHDNMSVACVTEETHSKLVDRGWALLRFTLPDENPSEVLCNRYEGTWHSEHNGCRGDISDLQCSLMGGKFIDNLKICHNDICPENKTYTLCVTESSKHKLIDGEWTDTMILNDNQMEIGSYLKQVEILDENYARVSMSYPTNDAKHEIYPDNYQSIVSDCTEQSDTATLSLLYLQKIDIVQNQMIFRQENKTFDGLQCDEAFWQELARWGYCGPPRPLIFNTESLVSSIVQAQNRTDLMLDLPQYLPSGYSVQKITVDSDGKSAMLYVSKKPVINEMPACEFTWDDEGIFLFYSKPPENFDWNTKYVKYADDPKKQLVTINDNPGYVEDRWVGDRFGMPIPQQSKVVWYIDTNDEIIEIHSSLSGEKLIKIAQSLEVGK